MTLPKGYHVGDKRKIDRKEKLKEIGNWALLLTIPAGIVILVIGYIMENFLMHLGIFILLVPFGIWHFGFDWRERTKGDWVSLIFLGIMLGIAIWFAVTFGFNCQGNL